jgi:phosphohistidine phosphatase
MSARQLVLLRHAKAESPIGVADSERPLSARGRADARAAGAWLAGHPAPELVLCSPARRTRQTWHAVATGLPDAVTPEVRYEPRLYTGGADELLALVRGIEGHITSALLIGHNPTLSQLAFELDPDGGLDSDGLRTCGLTVHAVAGQWRDCSPARATVAATYTARAR